MNARSRYRSSPSPSAYRVRRAGSGFTLVELLIACAIAAALAAVAAPNWRNQVGAFELRERADALAAALGVARSEAVKRGTRVDLCPSADRTACASAAWEAGWLMFVNDAGGDGRAPGAPIVGNERAARPGITIRGNRPIADYVSYTSAGHARKHDGALQMGTFVVCRPGQEAQKVVLANSGRVRVDATREVCP
jgi:type IV fimbrial biogenesis protein FimT